jgi:two-component system phosphate regulon sensor histidine kinase PhoR
VDLRQLVTSSIQHIQDSVESRPHDIKFDIMDAPMVLAGDTGQLSQLAFNVIGNAMKYGAAGTPIHVALKRAGSQAIFTVEDQGDGIPPEHLPRLTERFYRVDDARSRSVGGTGLGLSIVKHICERHQGQLQIESEVGRGTKVKIRFPLLPPSES